MKRANNKKISSLEDFEIEGDTLIQYTGTNPDVIVPDFIRHIEHHAFSGCDFIKNITIPNSVTSIGADAFSGCTNLTSITIPENATNIGRGISLNVFAGCSKLEKIIVADKNRAFYSQDNCLIDRKSKMLIAGCKNSVIPNDITSIGYRAFFGCSELTSITIPNSVTKIDKIAFADCRRLANIVITNNAISIGDSAFYGCSSLTSITFAGTKAQWEAIKKDGFWDNDTGNYTIHCTDGDIVKADVL